jgi:hypothetical protein
MMPKWVPPVVADDEDGDNGDDDNGDDSEGGSEADDHPPTPKAADLGRGRRRLAPNYAGRCPSSYSQYEEETQVVPPPLSELSKLLGGRKTDALVGDTDDEESQPLSLASLHAGQKRARASVVAVSSFMFLLIFLTSL